MKTINLLPPQLKKQQQIVAILKTSRLVLGLILTLSLGWGGGIYGFYRYFQSVNQQKLTEIDQLTKAVTAGSNLEKQILATNHRLATASSIKPTENWSQILTEVAKYSPATIKLSALSLQAADPNQPLLQITGSGVNRRTVIEYQLALESSPIFKDVKITSMGSIPTNIISFTISVAKEQP